MDLETSSGDEKRGSDRLLLNLPVRGRVGTGELMDFEVVGITTGGMQIKSSNFDVIKKGFNEQQNSAEFEIRIVGRLAWAQSGPEDSYVTGWEFEMEGGEVRVG